MSRPLRCNLPGVLYHITSRGNGRQNIVRSDADRRAFVEALGRVTEQRRWILHAWVLMTNHLHLALETPLSNLSAGMRDLLSEHATNFNKTYHRVGHLFQHRFHARIVEREGHLLELVRYLPLNPVRSGMVARPEDWKWSSYRATAGFDVPPRWLEIEATLAEFDPVDRGRAQSLFRDWVAQGTHVYCGQMADGQKGRTPIEGSPEFRDRIQRWIDSEERSREISRRQRHVSAPALDSVVALVKSELNLTDADLRPRSRNHARKVVAELGHVECGLTYRAMANQLGGNAWALAKLRSQSLQLEATDADYALKLNRLRERLSGLR